MSDQPGAAPFETAISSPVDADSTQGPPVKAPSAAAWIYALTPIIGAIIEFAGTAVYPDLTQSVAAINALYIGLYFGAAAGDLAGMKAAYRNGQLGDLNIQNVPAIWWVLLGPAYLWRRTTFLRQPRTMFWVWWVAIAIYFVVGSRDRIALRITGEKVEYCGSTFAVVNLRSFYARIPLLKAKDITATSVGDIHQLSNIDTVRTCNATVQSSDGTARHVHYTLTLQPDGQTYFAVALEQ